MESDGGGESEEQLSAPPYTVRIPGYGLFHVVVRMDEEPDQAGPVLVRLSEEVEAFEEKLERSGRLRIALLTPCLLHPRNGPGQCPVELQGEGKPCLVRGKPMLTAKGEPFVPTPSVFAALSLLVQDWHQGGPGLTREQLNVGGKDVRRQLQDLATRQEAFARVFCFTPGTGKKRLDRRFHLARSA